MGAITAFDIANLNAVTPRAYRSKLGDLLKSAQTGQLTYRETGASGNLLSTDGLVVVTAAGSTTQTLPAASSVPAGKTIQLKVVGAGQVTIAPSGSDTIDGVSGNDATTQQWERRVLISNGVNGWYT